MNILIKAACCCLLLPTLGFAGIGAADTDPPPINNSASIEQIQQIQNQLKVLNTQQQKQVAALNNQLQTQLKQVQTELQNQIQSLNTQTQTQMKQLQTNFEQQLAKLQSEMKH